MSVTWHTGFSRWRPLFVDSRRQVARSQNRSRMCEIRLTKLSCAAQQVGIVYFYAVTKIKGLSCRLWWMREWRNLLTSTHVGYRSVIRAVTGGASLKFGVQGASATNWFSRVKGARDNGIRLYTTNICFYSLYKGLFCNMILVEYIQRWWMPEWKKNPHISHLTINSWSATERSIFKMPNCQDVWQNCTRSLVYSCHFAMVLSPTLEKVQVWFLLPKNEHVGPMYSPTLCSVKLQLHKIITSRWYQPFQHLIDILHKASKSICRAILGSDIKQMQTLSTPRSALFQMFDIIWFYPLLVLGAKLWHLHCYHNENTRLLY